MFLICLTICLFYYLFSFSQTDNLVLYDAVQTLMRHWFSTSFLSLSFIYFSVTQAETWLSFSRSFSVRSVSCSALCAAGSIQWWSSDHNWINKSSHVDSKLHHVYGRQLCCKTPVPSENVRPASSCPPAPHELPVIVIISMTDFLQ